jgi:hypothetical protein
LLLLFLGWEFFFFFWCGGGWWLGVDIENNIALFPECETSPFNFFPSMLSWLRWGVGCGGGGAKSKEQRAKKREQEEGGRERGKGERTERRDVEEAEDGLRWVLGELRLLQAADDEVCARSGEREKERGKQREKNSESAFLFPRRRPSSPTSKPKKANLPSIPLSHSLTR